MEKSKILSGWVVGRGCVGECGSSSIVEYKVTATTDKLMVVQKTESSLCPNTGAFAWIVVNNVMKASGEISQGARVFAEAGPGANVVVHVQTLPLYNDISCVRLGELKYAVVEQDFLIAGPATDTM